MKASRTLTFAVWIALAGFLPAQPKGLRVPDGVGPKESLFGERHSPETEKRIRLSETKVQTQAETIRLLEARIKELEAELAALKAGKPAVPAPAPAP
jgi:hypothetical protein